MMTRFGNSSRKVCSNNRAAPDLLSFVSCGTRTWLANRSASAASITQLSTVLLNDRDQNHRTTCSPGHAEPKRTHLYVRADRR